MNSTIHQHDISDHVWSIWSLSFPGEKEAGEERPGITDCLSMRCSGFFVQEFPDGIFRRSTAIGKYSSSFLSLA